MKLDVRQCFEKCNIEQNVEGHEYHQQYQEV